MNRILYMRDVNDRKVTNPSHFKQLTFQYYQDLLGTENPLINPATVEAMGSFHPYRCSPDLITQLQAIPSHTELKAITFEMPKNKAHGSDEFPIEFFTSSLGITGGSLVEAIQEFFISG